MRRVVILALVAAMLMAFSAQGFWSGTGAASTGRDVDVTSYTQPSGTVSTPTDHGDEPLVRAHPRGLP